MKRARATRPARGSSLIEVLIAMAILAMLMVGVLQLFSLALLTDSGSAARTDMTLRAQQVAENIRYIHYLWKQNLAFPAAAGLPSRTSIINGTTASLPYNSAMNPTVFGYWGPNGANVFDRENPTYRISYTYSSSGTPNYWFLTVSVTFAEAPTGLSYVGPGARVKRVDYVCQVPR